MVLVDLDRGAWGDLLREHGEAYCAEDALYCDTVREVV